MRFTDRIVRDVHVAGWGAQVCGTGVGRRFDAWVARTCPDKPDFRGRDVTLSMAPSLIVGFVLRYYAPAVIALEAWSLQVATLAFVAGRFASALVERLGMRRLDEAYARWWRRRTVEPRPQVARVVALGRRLSGGAARWALVSLTTGAALALVAIGVRELTGTPAASAPIGLFALLLVMTAMLLAVVIVLGGIVEILTPIVLGPPSRDGHVLSREELGTLRPLLDSGPAKLAREAWEVLRTLRA